MVTSRENENCNVYKKLSWKLILVLISIFLSIMGFSYLKVEGLDEKKVDKELYNRDRTELLTRLDKMDEKLNVLVQRP